MNRDIPQIPGVPDLLIEAINDRLRKVGSNVSTTNIVKTKGSAAIAGPESGPPSGGVVTATPTPPNDFTIGTITAQWHELVARPGKNSPGSVANILLVTIPVTPPSPIGTTTGAHIYVENPDQSTLASSVLDGTTPLTSTYPQGVWTPEDYGQHPTSGFPLTIQVLNATPGQQLRVYVQAFSDEVDPTPIRTGLTGATQSALVTVPALQASKIGNGLEYEPNCKLVSVTVLPLDTSTGTSRTPIAVKVDTSVLSNPAPDDWGCEVCLVWDITPDQEPQIATGTFSVEEIAKFDGVLPAGADGITTPHTIALDTPTSIMGLTVYVRALKAQFSTSGRDGTVRRRILRNTIVPGVTPSAHITVGTLSGTIDVAAALANSISSEFHVVTVGGQQQLQMLALNMAKATNLSNQFVFDSAAGVQKLAQIDAGIIITGYFQVGGGGNKVSQMKIFDTTNTLIGWVGDDSNSSGAVGAWFKRIYIGGTNPSTAKIVADSLGNVAISGSLIVGAVQQANTATIAAIFNGPIQATQVVAGQFTGCTLSLTKNGITSTIDNIFEFGIGGYIGAKFRNDATGTYSAVWPGGFLCAVPGGASPVQVNGGNGDGQLIVQSANNGTGRRFEFRSGRGATVTDFGAGVSGDGKTTVVSFMKPDTTTGTLTFCMGWLIATT